MTGVTTRLREEIGEFAEDDDLKRSDLWLFGPLLMVMLAMPLAIAAVLGASLWFAAQRLDLSTTEVSAVPPATTFASRWPDKALPETVLR